MPVIEVAPGVLEIYTSPKKPRKRVFNSIPFIMRVLRHVLTAGRAYHHDEIIVMVNESAAGQKLHPPFRGANAEKLLDRLVRNEKLTKAGEFYTLIERKE